MKSFEVNVKSEFPEWNRYNVFLTAVCFAGGEVTDYVNAGGEGAASDPTLVTPPCESADVYLYVVAREFPASTAIAASPPFDVDLVVRSGGAETVTTYPVNQFGGLSAKLTVDG